MASFVQHTPPKIKGTVDVSILECEEGLGVTWTIEYSSPIRIFPMPTSCIGFEGCEPSEHHMALAVWRTRVAPALRNHTPRDVVRMAEEAHKQIAAGEQPPALHVCALWCVDERLCETRLVYGRTTLIEAVGNALPGFYKDYDITAPMCRLRVFEPPEGIAWVLGRGVMGKGELPIARFAIEACAAYDTQQLSALAEGERAPEASRDASDDSRAAAGDGAGGAGRATDEGCATPAVQSADEKAPPENTLFPIKEDPEESADALDDVKEEVARVTDDVVATVAESAEGGGECA